MTDQIEPRLSTTERPSGAKVTTLYIPAGLRAAADALHEAGHSWSDIFQVGLQVMTGQGDHEHTFACTGCGTTFDVNAAKYEHDRLSAQYAAALAEIESLRESLDAGAAGYEGLEQGLAALRDQLRDWQAWAAGIRATLGVKALVEVHPTILELLAGHPPAAPSAPQSPVPLPGLDTPEFHAEAASVARERLAEALGPPSGPVLFPAADGDPGGDRHPGDGEVPARPDLLDLPAEDPHLAMRGFPFEAGAGEVPAVDWAPTLDEPFGEPGPSAWEAGTAPEHDPAGWPDDWPPDEGEPAGTSR